MKKLLNIFDYDYKPTGEEALIYTAIIGFVLTIIATILFQCVMLPVAEEKHIETLNNLEKQLLEAENKYETATINIMIKMENNDWIKQQEANQSASVFSLAFGIGILIVSLLYVLLTIIIDILIP